MARAQGADGRRCSAPARATSGSTFFAGHEVCFAPVLTMNEARAHPHNVARGTFTEVDGAPQPAPAPRFSRTPGAVERAPVVPGADTDTALADWGFPPRRGRRAQGSRARSSADRPERDRLGEALQLTPPGRLEREPGVVRRGLLDLLGDEHLARHREVGDPRREVHHRAVVVAAAADDGPNPMPACGETPASSPKLSTSRSAMSQAATASASTNITSSPMCFTTRPPRWATTSFARRLEAPRSKPASSAGVSVLGVRREPDEVDEADREPEQRRVRRSTRLAIRWRLDRGLRSGAGTARPSAAGITSSDVDRLLGRLGQRHRAARPPAAAGPRRSTRNSEIAASATRAIDEPIARVNCSVGSSPNMPAPPREQPERLEVGVAVVVVGERTPAASVIRRSRSTRDPGRVRDLLDRQRAARGGSRMSVDGGVQRSDRVRGRTICAIETPCASRCSSSASRSAASGASGS